MKPLIWKELRENVRWVPIGLLVVTVICYMVHPSRINGYNNPLLATGLVNYFAIITPLLAFALGVVQSFRDLQPAAGAYLNHRGVTTSDVFLAKIVSGFVLYMTSVIVPLIGFAAWIAFNGMWSYPMRPAQVVPGLVFAMIAFLMHPAAMLMMSRGASWWGTRLFPLVPAGAVLIPFYGYLHQGGWYWAIVCFLVALPTLVWMIAIARQGWQELASDPPAASVNPVLKRRWLMPAYILVGTTLCLISAVAFSIGVIESTLRSNEYLPVPFVSVDVERGSDELWLTTRLQSYDAAKGNYKNETLGGEIAKNGATVNALSAAAKDRLFSSFAYMWRLRPVYNSTDGFFTASNNRYGSTLSYAYDTRGYLLGYETYPRMRWVNTIAADGVHPAGALIGKPFKMDPLGNGQSAFGNLSNIGYPSILIDSEGMSFIDNDPIALRRIIEMPIEGATLVESVKGDPPRLIVRSGTELHEFKVIEISGVENWYVEREPGSNSINMDLSRKLKLDVEPIRKFRMPPTSIEKETLFIAWTPSGLYLSENNGRIVDSNLTAYRLLPDTTAEEITFAIDPDSLPKTDDDKFSVMFVVAGMFPGAVFVLGFALAWYQYVLGEMPHSPFAEIANYPIATSTIVISFLVVTALSFWLVRGAAYRRGLSRRQTRLWTWSVPLLGLAAPLSIIAIYRLVHRESCRACAKPRRVDEPTCEHCAAAWQPPTGQGIEITDRNDSFQVSQG